MEREQINHFTKPPDCLAILKSWRCRFSVSHPGIKQQTHRWRQNRAKVVQLVEPAARQEALITRVSCNSSVRRQQRTGGGLPCTIKQKYFHRIQETGEGRKKLKIKCCVKPHTEDVILPFWQPARGCGAAGQLLLTHWCPAVKPEQPLQVGSDQTFDTSAAEPLPVPTQLVAPARISDGLAHLQLRHRAFDLKCRCSAGGASRCCSSCRSESADSSQHKGFYPTDPPRRADLGNYQSNCCCEEDYKESWAHSLLHT